MRSTYATLLLLAVTTTACNRPVSQGQQVVSETYIHKYGVEIPQEQWTSRGQQGKVVSTLSDGVTLTKSFEGGVLDGDTTYSFPHSDTIEKVQTYANGEMIREVIHYASGKPAQESIYNGPNTDVTRWYENGAPLSKEHFDASGLVSGEYFTSKNQMESRIVNGEGIRIQHDAYGQMVSNDTFVGGHVTLVTAYHPNGSPKEVSPYVNDKINGIRRTYLPAGEPNSQEHWVDGNQQGTTLLFKNGEKYAEVPYVNGAKTGLERHFRNGKDVVEEITWVNDVRQGPCRTMIGDLTKTEWYHRGEIVPKHQYDVMNGKGQK